MKKTAHVFLKIARIIDCIMIPLFILGIVGFALGAQAFFAEAAKATTDEEVIGFMYGAYSMIVSAVTYFLLTPALIVGAVVANKGLVALETANSKSEVKAIAIANIVFGAFTCGAATVGGILSLCTRESDYNAVE